MPIDFHDPMNGATYAQRAAGPEWAETIVWLLSCENPRVVDVGCGGGTYCLAWLGVGATSVVGVDFSEANLRGAEQRCADVQGLSWWLGNAVDTGLPEGCAEVVFERALVHHLPDLTSAFTEARRLLSPDGQLFVQDRTMDDVLQPGSPSHLRGYFFTAFPLAAQPCSCRRRARLFTCTRRSVSRSSSLPVPTRSNVGMRRSGPESTTSSTSLRGFRTLGVWSARRRGPN